ncbi:MAG: universal stress protein [Myxococcales bacterium]|nr:universal stress protein [Myxococcales bacterium]
MRQILVGLDGSQKAPAVLGAARRLAERVGAQLLLFRAIGPPVGVPMEAFVVAPDDLVALLRREAREYLERLAADLPPQLVAGTRVAVNAPWRAICEVAREERGDLIVIGSQGHDSITHLLGHLVGTTAAKVVDHADRSVLVVREPDRFALPPS